MPTWPTDINALKDPVQDSDGAHVDVITIPASAPYTHQLGQGAPLSYPAGWQVIPPSGVPGIVAVSGGSHGTWTEVTNGTSLSAGQFSVDYSTSVTTGGTVYFAAADAGMTGVSITYTGALEWNKAVVLSAWNAIRAVVSGLGVANGLAGLDAATNLFVPSGHKLTVPGQTGNTTVNNIANQAVGMFLIPSGTASGSMITVNNTLVTATSHIFLQVHYAGNFITSVWPNLGGIVAGTSFPVQVGCSATLTANVECSYWIVN